MDPIGTLTNIPAGIGKDLWLQKIVFLCLLSITSFGIVILGGGFVLQGKVGLESFAEDTIHKPQNTAGLGAGV